MKLIFLATLIALVSAQRSFLIGSGIADVTGECAEGGFMGYAQPSQKGAGIHIRPRARAFVVGDQASGKVVAYVSVDLAMGVEMVKLEVVEKLQSMYGSSVFSRDNVLISGTHTHSTPGGIGGTALLDIANLGFNKVNYEAAVNGLFRAISNAYDTRVPGTIAINRGQVDNANINRSPASYLRDPDDERARYQYNTDHDMTLLKFVTNDKREIGEINFFAVHGTSMNNTNSLISGDNKGYAAQLFEKDMNPGFLPGKGPFVAAFGQSNEGDVSPNTKGPKCPDGSECDFVHSTCGNPPRTQGCIASGPGRDMFESTQIIGQLQYQAAKSLYNSATQQLNASLGVNFRHWYVDMQNVTIYPNFSDSGQIEHTCQAGLGYAFAGGTTDGPGDFDFTQGTNGSNPFWDFISSFIAKPTPEQKACQAPKPILLDVGLTKPIPWVSYILPMQVLQFGQVWILGVPAEFTTMAGRRLRNTFYTALKREGALTPDTVVIIAGLSNSYSHYVTTFQEYNLQRYEGASTLYGPHTLVAYQQIYDYLATQMARGLPVPPGPDPIDMRNRTIPSFLAPNPPDTLPSGTNFGDVYSDAQPSYKIGQTAIVTFWGANPRNDIMTDRTFLTVEIADPSGTTWTGVCDDACWDTKFKWAKVGTSSQSRVTVEWTIPTGTPAGTYRIRTFGNSKDAFKKLHPYTGTSRTFTVSS